MADGAYFLVPPRFIQGEWPLRLDGCCGIPLPKNIAAKTDVFVLVNIATPEEIKSILEGIKKYL